MSPFESEIIQLDKQLYPDGRAFKIAPDSIKDRLHRALAKSDARAYADAVSILDSIIPDNNRFTTQDAARLEVAYGLIVNEAVPLEDRKAAILRKMRHPGTIAARENWKVLQDALQEANFNVYVYPNRFPDGVGGYITMTPEDFSTPPYPSADIQLGDAQLGDFQMGGTPGNKVANSIYDSDDSTFDTGGNLKSTFFVGGTPAGEWADVLATRETEFRQLILRLKPVNTVAFLLINYV
jgi:hypothetical protein